MNQQPTTTAQQNKSNFFEFKIQFFKPQHKPMLLSAYTYAENHRDAEAIAISNIQAFLKAYGEDSTFKIMDYKVRKDIMFFATQPISPQT